MPLCPTFNTTELFSFLPKIPKTFSNPTQAELVRAKTLAAPKLKKRFPVLPQKNHI